MKPVAPNRVEPRSSSPADDGVIVVGAGVGGLACAIDLARSGCRVRVLEQRPQPGGKARVVRPGSLGVDAGPTVLTMAWVFDELFDAAGADFSETAVALAAISIPCKAGRRII